jgi:GDP-L-fucose synthase
VNSKKKILVLGSTGFIGQNIVDYLTSSDNAHRFNVLAPKRQELNLLDTQNIEKYLIEHRPDVVIFSAVNIQSLEDNLAMYFNFERCSQYYGKMITIGSGAEYDMKNYQPLMKESYFGENVPTDTYGLSKFVVSKDIEKDHRNIINLRVLGIFGKYEDYSRRFLSNNICHALLGKGISINKNMKFDFIDVNDFLRILDIFMVNEPVHRNYNICTAQPTELLKIANVIKDVHGDSEPVLVKNEGMNPEYSADNSRFINEFGPFEFTPIEESVAVLYQWYKSEIEQNNTIEKVLS